MKTLICGINMFDLDQFVYTKEDNEEPKLALKVPFDHLAKALVPYCYEKEIFEINLYGVSKFVKVITEDIQKRELKAYKENKIVIKEIANE